MTLKAVFAALFALFVATTALPGLARADIEIDVNQGEVRPLVQGDDVIRHALRQGQWAEAMRAP